tara:strand:+ start:568 stop:1404 length:837 start_codon:yes stop_codon:yes gene_type:complete
MVSLLNSQNAFLIITSIYFLVSGKGIKGLTSFFIYVLVLLIFISLFNESIIRKAGCSRSSSQAYYIILALSLWIVIFVGTTVLIEFFPGWKTPFSNTIGYTIVNLMGSKNVIDTFFNQIMSKEKESYKRDIFNMIYRDRSLILNELNTSNIKNFLEIMLGSTPYETIVSSKQSEWEYTYEPKIYGFRERANDESLDDYKKFINNKINNQETPPTIVVAINNMKKLLERKESVARFIWYILAGITTITISESIIKRPKCEKSTSEIQNQANELIDQNNS